MTESTTDRLTRGMRWLIVAGLAILLPAMATPGAQALQLSEAKIFIEINATDGDAGLQVFLDGDDWERMKAFDPDGNLLFDIQASGSVALQGMTELFFESAEPSFEEQPLADFLALFPEGTYRFFGRTTDGKPLRGKAELTHALPEGPVLISPVPGDDGVDPAATVVEWEPVANPPGSSIVGYQVIVEREVGGLRVFSADLGPEVTEVTVPGEFMEPATAYKYEVLAIEQSGNQTLSEGDFETGAGGGGG